MPKGFWVVSMSLVAIAFLVLALGLAAVSISDLVSGRRPEESIGGIVMLVVVVIVMFTLAFLKRRVAERLDSSPLRAEATMSMLDGFLAAATLAGLALHASLGWWWADPGAALVVAVPARTGRKPGTTDSYQPIPTPSWKVCALHVAASST